jgi:hypothetical protein
MGLGTSAQFTDQKEVNVAEFDIEKYRGRVCFPMYGYRITRTQYDEISDWSFEFIEQHWAMGKAAREKIRIWLDQAVLTRVMPNHGTCRLCGRPRRGDGSCEGEC